MSEYLRSAFSGWAAVILLGSGSALPFLLRKVPGSSAPFFKRMRPHYWIGYMTLLISFAHAWMSMSGGNMRAVDISGVWIATAALVVIMWQVALGLRLLTNPTQPQRSSLRRTHFWTMILLAGLILAHVVRNRP